MPNIYLFLIVCCLGSITLSAQHLHPKLVKGDTSQTQFIYTYNKDFYIGTYLRINEKDIVFRLRTGDTITLARDRVREVAPLFGPNGGFLGPRRYRIPRIGLARSRDVFGPTHTNFTHGWVLPNAIPVRKGDLTYRNLIIFYNELEYGFSENLSAAANAIFVVPSGSGFGLYNIRLKYARRLHTLLHVAATANVMRIDEPRFSFSSTPNPDHTIFYPQALASFGTSEHQLTFGFGFSKGSQTERLPDTGFTWHLSGLHTISPRWRLTGEYIVPMTGSTFQFGQIGLTNVRVSTRWTFGVLLVNDRVWDAFPSIGFGWRIAPRPFY